MKRIVLYFSLIILVNNLSAQDPQLFENEWFVNTVTIDGVEYSRPYPEFNGEAIFDNIEFTVNHNSCEEGFSSPIFYVDLDEFSINDGGVALVGICGEPSVTTFMEKHYTVYFLNNNWAKNPFNYEITGSGTNKTLTVTNPDGDFAVYGSEFLSIQDATSEIITLYPNPTNNKIHVSGIRESQNYSIYSITGKIVGEGTVSPNEPIEVSGLKAGLYILKLEGGHTERIVIY